ncbi:hypothetical protein Dtox_2822 [Desulfofarcimen acetoxidans DSM 771]|uniref:Uncharacterized protein n=1 Tax=Desulfofarcimen acetoxidans (strain ATCC 49208 / DSM 771 / KCTC 5769 / VKM B-1644 / 5575) TaxID=485916 RepID=C8W1W6_DESAS|nr:hypothetical protein [Desulfofarcimen acetoxidans]ACV63587.1 hypothetical protein Dtox_2822 [Desulfofarcimen acetoxidans DSM 771]
MSRSKGLLSDATKYEFARELGVANKLNNVNIDFNNEFSDELTGFKNTTGTLDFGNLSSRDCGNFVRLAIQKAEKGMI